MFHVKQHRSASFLGAVVVLSILILGCGGAAGSRGWAAPLPLDNLVLVSTSKGHLTAVDSSSRERVWRFPDCWSISDKAARKLTGIYGPPVASKDGQTLYVGDYSGHIYAFKVRGYNCDNSDGRASAGALKLSDHIIGGLALDSSGETLYVTSGDSLYSLRARDLEARIDNHKADVSLKRVFKAAKDIWSTPIITSSGILLSSLDGRLYMVDSESGAEKWRYSAGRSLASTPVVSGSVVLVGGFDGELHAVELSSGQERWTFDARHWVWSSPLVESGRAYFGDFDGRLYALDVNSGNEAWSVHLGKGAIRGTPAFARDTVIVGTEKGWLMGIDPSNQSKRWEIELGSAVAASIIVRNDAVYVAPKGCVTQEGSNEKVYYIAADPRTGSLQTAIGVC
jgi:outer membrane protein assembly factor BamB